MSILWQLRKNFASDFSHTRMSVTGTFLQTLNVEGVQKKRICNRQWYCIYHIGAGFCRTALAPHFLTRGEPALSIVESTTLARWNRAMPHWPFSPTGPALAGTHRHWISVRCSSRSAGRSCLPAAASFLPGALRDIRCNLARVTAMRCYPCPRRAAVHSRASLWISASAHGLPVECQQIVRSC